MSLLHIRKLSALYGDFQALFDIDFHADEGETIAIIGSNGAGKSTFLNSIAGVVPVAKDSIVFEGEPIGGLRSCDVVTRRAALVPEGRRLFPSLTVEENLLMGAYSGRRSHRSTKTHNDEAKAGTGAPEWSLEQVYDLFPQLRTRGRQPAASLSGGEQQMVAVGRALMSNPKLLMCDELSLGLAPKIIIQIYATLARVKAQGITLIIVEQDIRQALAVADRVYCFQEGRVSLEGRPADVTHEQISRAYFGV